MTTGTILILNGASSSGKTSIVRAWQEHTPELWLDAGLDRFLWMMPGRYLERPLWDEVLGLAVRAGEPGHRLVAGMHRSIKALAATGNHVVADHVLVEPAWLADCATLFRDQAAYLIGVRCPLDVLEARERERRNRTLGQARAQFECVHGHGLYDLELDTSLLSPAACAEKIDAFLRSGVLPIAFPALAERLSRLPLEGTPLP